MTYVPVTPDAIALPGILTKYRVGFPCTWGGYFVVFALVCCVTYGVAAIVIGQIGGHRSLARRWVFRIWGAEIGFQRYEIGRVGTGCWVLAEMLPCMYTPF